MSSGSENVWPSTWVPWASRVVRGWTEGGPVDNLPWPPGRPRTRASAYSRCTLGARYTCSGTPTLPDFQSRLCIHRIHWMASNANIAFIVYFLFFVFFYHSPSSPLSRLLSVLAERRSEVHSWTAVRDDALAACTAGGPARGAGRIVCFGRSRAHVYVRTCEAVTWHCGRRVH